MLFSPLSKVMMEHRQVHYLYSIGLRNFSHENEIVIYAIPLLLFILAISILCLVTIFLYDNRPLQLRLCVYSILCSIILIGIIAFYYFYIRNQNEWVSNSFSITVIFPIVNIILIFQAFRAIGRDDLLIKSYDRLR